MTPLDRLSAELATLDTGGNGKHKPGSSFFDQVETAKKQVAKKAPPPAPWVPFPVEALPEPIRSYVIRSAEVVGVDPSFTGTAILPCLTAAIGTSRVIRLRDRWDEPAVLWAGIVGLSGCGKSPALDQGTCHVRRRQAVAFEFYELQRREYERANEAFKLDLDDWKRTGRKKDEPRPEAPDEPICLRFMVADATVEALGPILAENERGVLLLRDELSAWFNSQNEYKQGKGSDTEKWLSIHGCRELLTDRRTGDKRTIYVRRAGVSIVGGIQPGTLRRLFDPAAFETGLAARWLLCYPPKRRRLWTEARVDRSLDQAVEAVFDHLYDLQPDERDGRTEPAVLELTPDGKTAFVEWYDAHSLRLLEADEAAAALLSKCEAAAARLSLIVHCIRHSTGDAGEAVDQQSITAGIELATWYANEGLRLYGLFAETDEDRQQRQVVEFIERRGGSITPNDLRRRSRQFNTSDDAERFLDQLVKAGIGSWHTTTHGDTGGRPTRTFTLVSSVSVSQTQESTARAEVSDTDTAPENGNSWSRAGIGFEYSPEPNSVSVSQTQETTGQNRVSDTDTAETVGNYKAPSQAGDTAEWETFTL